MASILLVEDDEFFRKAIVEFLSSEGHKLLQAPNGRAAIEIMNLQKFDLVISDIQMPGLNGIELLEWSLKHNPIPFIIMTGFSTILETKSAHELGAKDFIAKPFKNVELLEAIERVLGINKKFPIAQDPKNFCKVSINEFVSKKQVEFDIYVKLSNAKFVKIANTGEELSGERIEHYKTKGVKFLYIEKDDFDKLVDFNLNLATLMKDKKNISPEKKINFLKYTGEVIMAKAFISGVDKDTYTDAQTFVGLTINTITNSPDYLDLLSMLNAHSDYLYSQSVGVSMYSYMMAQKMGFESNHAFFKLSMAGMFHDIGKKEISIELLEKNRALLTAEEKKQIDSHVVRGQEILISIKGVPEDVAQLVYEHHEDVAGLGYPFSLPKKKQHPLSKILQLSSLFVEYALKGPQGPGMGAVEAIKHIETHYRDRYDLGCMKALKEIFNIKS